MDSLAQWLQETGPYDGFLENTLDAGSGKYIFNKGLGRLVQVSSSVPYVAYIGQCFCPKGGYWSHNLGHTPVYVESRTHKRRLLQERGLAEKASLTRREL